MTDEDHDTPGNYKHGLHQKNRGKYYETLPQRDQELIDAVAEDLIEKSNFEREDASAFEKCRQIAVDIHQRRRADGYIAEKGLTQEKTVGIHENYGEINETQENVLFITKDRLSRESRLAMKDLGVLDVEKSNSGVAAKSFMEQIADNMDDDD